MRRSVRRIGLAIAAIVLGTATAMIGGLPAWAAFDGPWCSTPTGFGGGGDCYTGWIYPHSTQHWVRIVQRSCVANHSFVTLQDQGGRPVGSRHALEGAGASEFGDLTIPGCNYWSTTVYSLNPGYQYRVYVESEAGNVGAARICNFTYNPNNGDTC